MDGTPVAFTAVSDANATLDLTGYAPTATAGKITVTSSKAATLQLTYTGTPAKTKTVKLNKGVTELAAADLIPGLNPATPLTVQVLKNLNASGTIVVDTVLADDSVPASANVTGKLTLNY
ncbi:hypothetical protein CSV79_08790 [Sporosarcina sp. P13]|uniref:hypothetical protein n=1 Tax=Sporosarcina sp. P13 TaxID=2048263 RepID=UPI000C16CFF5|nr:hypothetical protein [Sporosarcina sp. P13]PIC64006.1 hypothetical protein CSV79_08790 [Sporosarcina sp. P13]